MKEAFERPIAESNNGQKRNELEFHTLKFWFLYAYCIIIIIIIHVKFGPHLPVHEHQYARCLDLRGSAQAIPFLFPFVGSNNNDVHDGLRINQALFGCINYAIHSLYVQVLVATADLQSLY